MPTDSGLTFEQGKEYATREVFGEVLVKLGEQNKDIYALDGDVMNSTFTEPFKKACPERFVESYIAEQNMVSVGAGLSRLGKIPFAATFAAFLTRAADQIRMARVSEANMKFVGITCRSEHWRRWSFANGIGRYCFVWRHP